MRKKGISHNRRRSIFFILGLSHDNVENYYRTNSLIVYNNRFTLTELENMFPFEREIYVSLLVNHIEEENQRNKKSLSK